MKRAFVKDIVVYGLGEGLQKLAVFIYIPIYTRYFTTEEFGVLSVVGTTVGILGAFLSLGTEAGYVRLYFETTEAKNRQTLTSSWLLFCLLWGSCLTLLVLPASGYLASALCKDANARQYFVLAIIAAPIGLVGTVCSLALRNQFRPWLFVGLSALQTAVTVALSLYFGIGLDQGLTGLYVGTLIGSIGVTLVRLFSVRDLLTWKWSSRYIREMVLIGVPLVPASMATWIFWSSDRLMLAEFSTMDEVALYSIANTIANAMMLPMAALGQAFTPHAMQWYSSDEGRASVQIGRSFTYIVFGFALLAVGITSFAPEAIRLLATKKYESAVAGVGPLTLSLVAYATTQVTGFGISLSKKTVHCMVHTWVAALGNVALNLILIPPYGMVGASWATFASYSYLTLAYYLTSQRYWQVAYERNRVGCILILTLVFCVVAPCLPQLTLGYSLLLKASYVLAFVAALFAFRAVDSREISLLRQLLRG